jgi:transcription elongation factor Elf1
MRVGIMADEFFTVLTVECPHCNTKQTVHVAFWRNRTLSDRGQTLLCVKCGKEFDVTIPDQIVGGPFAV